jgi:hypothetical protein
MERTNPVKVSKAVWQGIEAVRLSGKTNMFDAPMVQRLAFDMEHFETVLWMEEHPDPYRHGIFAGFKVEGGEN